MQNVDCKDRCVLTTLFLHLQKSILNVTDKRSERQSDSGRVAEGAFHVGHVTGHVTAGEAGAGETAGAGLPPHAQRRARGARERVTSLAVVADFVQYLFSVVVLLIVRFSPAGPAL